MSSVYKSRLLIALLLANIFLQVGSFTLVKLAAVESSDYVGIFFSAFYVAALTLVLVRAYIWQLILRRAELSKVYPLNAIVPVFILIISVSFFNEPASINNIIGSAVLVLGLLLLINER